MRLHLKRAMWNVGLHSNLKPLSEFLRRLKVFHVFLSSVRVRFNDNFVHVNSTTCRVGHPLIPPMGKTPGWVNFFFKDGWDFTNLTTCRAYIAIHVVSSDS